MKIDKLEKTNKQRRRELQFSVIGVFCFAWKIWLTKMTRSPNRNAIAKNQERQPKMNSYYKSLLFSISLVVFMCQSVAADEILVRYKSGETGLLEVIGVVGQTVRLKNPKTGNTKDFSLETFDEATLRRIITELGKQIKNSPAARPPSPKPSGVTGKATEMTLARLEVLGENFVGKQVRFSKCKFIEVDQSQVTKFPSIQIKTNGLITTYDKSEANKWIGIFWKDEASDKYCHATIANKQRWAEYLLALKSQDKVIIEGVVVDLPSSGYGIIVTKIEKVK